MARTHVSLLVMAAAGSFAFEAQGLPRVRPVRPAVLQRSRAHVAAVAELPAVARALIPGAAAGAALFFALQQVESETRAEKEERLARERAEAAKRKQRQLRSTALIGGLPVAAIAATVLLGPIIAPPDQLSEEAEMAAEINAMAKSQLTGESVTLRENRIASLSDVEKKAVAKAKAAAEAEAAEQAKASKAALAAAEKAAKEAESRETAMKKAEAAKAEAAAEAEAASKLAPPVAPSPPPPVAPAPAPAPTTPPPSKGGGPPPALLAGAGVVLAGAVGVTAFGGGGDAKDKADDSAPAAQPTTAGPGGSSSKEEWLARETVESWYDAGIRLD
jgi:hypothetical protein